MKDSARKILVPRRERVAAMATVAVLALACGFVAEARAEDVALEKLPGARIDANWFRYADRKSGVVVDIPTRGFRYDVPADGSNLTLKSPDGGVTITVSAHGVKNVLGSTPSDARQSVARLYKVAVDNAVRKHGNITYKVKRDTFFVLSGEVEGNTYYERLNVAPNCPASFGSLRVFHRKALTHSLDRLVTRMSLSLRATCPAPDAPA